MTSSFSGSGIPCQSPTCGSMQPPPTVADFVDYFEGRLWVCLSCEHSQDLWTVLLARANDDHPLMPSAVSLGLAESTTVTVELQPNEMLQLDFAALGIPLDATVIDVVMTPIIPAGGQGLFPAVGMQHIRTSGLPHYLSLFPVVLPSAQATAGPVATKVNILIIWMPTPTEPELEPLFSAVKAFTTGDFRGSIIPAQIAVELKLSQVFTDHFSQFAGKGDTRSFLQNGASYGHQLRFLLPSLFSSVGAPRLSAEVSSALQSLRGKRDKVGHEHRSTERAEAAPMLLAGLFGYRYVSVYGALLAPRKTNVDLK